MILGCVGLAVGCRSNPFELNDTDRASRVSESKLREINDAALSRFAKPKVEVPAPDENIRSRFDGVAS
ncbi:MAG: hypothetical protein EBR51_12760, partial [Gammaproteobacteria bacterium]|nr:hypothetical protein [Gammaproteobacteria bacterium]